MIDIKITDKIIKVSITSPQNSLGTVANGTEYLGLDREIPTNLYIYIYIYIYFPTSFGHGCAQSLWFLKSMLHYLTQLSDIYVIYLIHIQRERKVVNGRSTLCHGLNLVLDLNQKMLKFLAFLSNSFLYL